MSNARNPRRVFAVLAPAVGLLLAGCALSGPGVGVPNPASPAGPAFTPAATPTIMPAGAHNKVSTGGPTLAPTAFGPLDGKVIVVDPGHNGGFNPAINNKKTATPFGLFQCISTGSETPGRKVTEHQLNWEVSERLATHLRALGATVIMTRPDDDGLGPCNIDRAAIANKAHADLLLSVHTDGEAMGRHGIADPQGFHVQLDTKMLGGTAQYSKSMAAAENVVRNMLAITAEPLTNYVPRKPAGIWQRTKDLMVLAGLTSTPGVLIEMGNMMNPANLARLTDPAEQDAIAKALAASAVDTLTVPQYMTPSPTPSDRPSRTPSGTPTASPGG